MLTDRHLENYADVLWWGLTTARRNPSGKATSSRSGFIPVRSAWLKFFTATSWRTASTPSCRANLTPEMERSFYRLSNARQLVFVAPGEAQLVRRLNGSIFLNARTP